MTEKERKNFDHRRIQSNAALVDVTCGHLMEMGVLSVYKYNTIHKWLITAVTKWEKKNKCLDKNN